MAAACSGALLTTLQGLLGEAEATKACELAAAGDITCDDPTLCSISYLAHHTVELQTELDEVAGSTSGDDALLGVNTMFLLFSGKYSAGRGHGAVG